MPKIIWRIFKDKKDERRVQLGEILRNVDLNKNKFIIEHIIEQIWQEFDTDNNGSLDRQESYNFIKSVLEYK